MNLFFGIIYFTWKLVGYNGAACSSTLICNNFDHFGCILGFCQCIPPFVWDSSNQLQPCQCKLPYILASNGQCGISLIQYHFYP